MHAPRRLLGLATAAALAATVVATAVPASAHPRARTVAHLDLAGGQQPENLVLRPDGSAAVTFALTGQVAEVSRDGRVDVLAQLPAPAAGRTPVLGSRTFAAGIDRVGRSLYVALSTGTAEETGIWRVTRGKAPVRVAALPATSLLNGLAVDADNGWIYVADSVAATVWRAPLDGDGPATAWYRSPALAPTQGFLGANGLKLHDGAVWVSNLDAGTLLRVPVRWNGAAGTARTVASGLGAVDDFAFTGRGDELLATGIKENVVLRLTPGRRVTRVLSEADGLSNPTAIAVEGRRAVVTSAAYFTQKDPNVLGVRLAR